VTAALPSRLLVDVDLAKVFTVSNIFKNQAFADSEDFNEVVGDQQPAG